MAEVMCQRSFTAIFASRLRADKSAIRIFAPSLQHRCKVGFSVAQRWASAAEEVTPIGRPLGRPVHSGQFSIAP
jgi:hypothetical protein